MGFGIMTTTTTPIRHDFTIYRGTDHVLQFQRVNENNVPIIPSAGKAQVRSSFQGALWVECVVAIDAEGIISVSIPESATASAAWDSRVAGKWDLEVVVAGKRLRWVEGNVTVSQDVTRDA
jgi:hypothetical protein